MSNAALLEKSELYAPRDAGFVGLVETAAGTIKINAIAVSGSHEIESAALDAATALLRAYAVSGEAPAHLGAGFAVLHRGDQGLWLLMHWWLSGGIASEQLWRAEVGASPVVFAPADDRLMACVWELGVIDFERRAWIETAMAGRPLADYLAFRMPRSTV